MTQLLAQGTIKSPAGWPRSRCLVHVFQTLRDVVRLHQPTVCAIEGLFYAQNLQTALTWAKEHRVELQGTQIQEEVDQLSVDLSLAERYPTFLLGGNLETRDNEFPLQRNLEARI